MKYINLKSSRANDYLIALFNELRKRDINPEDLKIVNTLREGDEILVDIGGYVCFTKDKIVFRRYALKTLFPTYVARMKAMRKFIKGCLIHCKPGCKVRYLSKPHKLINYLKHVHKFKIVLENSDTSNISKSDRVVYLRDKIHSVYSERYLVQEIISLKKFTCLNDEQRLIGLLTKEMETGDYYFFLSPDIPRINLQETLVKYLKKQGLRETSETEISDQPNDVVETKEAEAPQEEKIVPTTSVADDFGDLSKKIDEQVIEVVRYQDKPNLLEYLQSVINDMEEVYLQDHWDKEESSVLSSLLGSLKYRRHQYLLQLKERGTDHA